jgi:hypothetical protein
MQDVSDLRLDPCIASLLWDTFILGRTFCVFSGEHGREIREHSGVY